MRLLVTNMGDRKTPWRDVPVEVIIEYERKKQEQLKDHREQLRVPMYSPAPPKENPHSDNEEAEEEHKIVINFI